VLEEPLICLGDCGAVPGGEQIHGRIVHRRLRSIYPDVVGRLIAAAERTTLPAQA
jgi:hypothetical protein